MISLVTSRTRVILACAIALSAAGIAGAANVYRPATTSSGGGSEGATAILQTSPAGGALQGEVASAANSHIKLPFGLLGEYDAAGSTFGIGTVGLSTTGYGIAGESLSDAQPSVLGDPGGNGIGVEGVQPNANSTAPAIYGESKSNGDAIEGMLDEHTPIVGGFHAAISGYDPTSHGYIGVFGESSNGMGVQGIAESASAAAGVMGEASQSGAGVYGINGNPATPSPTGFSPDRLAGVAGVADGGPAGYFFGSGSGDGIDVTTVGALGANVSSTATSGIGLSAYGNDVGIETASSAENGYPDQAIGATGRQFGVIATTTANGTTYPLYLTSPLGTVAYIDGTGALYLHNGVHSFARTRDGGSVESYTPQSSAPTIEDVGEGHLLAGTAIVRIGSAFGASLDRAAAYHVFLTPEAETNGLYVARKTPDYFVVRELHGGRNSLAFDYRVVGAVDGKANAQMTLRAGHDLATAASPPHVRPVVVTRARAIPPAAALALAHRGVKPFVAPPVRAPLVLPR